MKTDVQILSEVTSTDAAYFHPGNTEYVKANDALIAMQQAREDEIWDFCYWYRNQGSEIMLYPINEVMTIYQRFKEENK